MRASLLRARVPWVLAVAALPIAAACSGAVGPGRDAGPSLDGAAPDVRPVVCDPPCAAPMVCSGGACVMGGDDADGDGIAAEIDCDDNDPSVGNLAERACSSACAPGIEQCVDGAWMPCTAPTDCTCADGTSPRLVPCERCGVQRQICQNGHFVNDGTCNSGECSPGSIDIGAACGGCGNERRTCRSDCTWGPQECSGGGECESGTMDTDTESCGECGEGTHTRTRTCTDACSWGTWSDFGACDTAATCSPGATQMDSRACGNCSTGTQTRTRSCDGTTCQWGAWSGYGTCNGGGTCAPGAMRGGCDHDYSGATTSCGVQVCTSACTWGGCQVAPGVQCRSKGGTFHRCCTPSGGGSGWQYCDAATCNWYTCASHTCS